MRGLLSFLYGLAAYLACVAALLYFIGFSGNLLVPKSVDVGGSAPWADALRTDLLLLALFGVQHSVMARRGFKRWWLRVVPAAVERSTYVVATCVVLALMFRFWVPIEAPVVWQVEHRAGAALLWSGSAQRRGRCSPTWWGQRSAPGAPISITKTCTPRSSRGASGWAARPSATCPGRRSTTGKTSRGRRLL